MYHKDDSEDDDQRSESEQTDDPPSDSGGGMYGDPADMSESDEEPTADEESAGDSSDSVASGFDAPLLGGQDEEPEQETGTFYVKHVEDVAVTLHEVNTGQIFTVVENPELERREIIEAILIAKPPLQTSYLIDEIQSQRSVSVEVSPQSPTTQAKTVASDMETGQAIAIEREGEGEIHVLTVDPDITEDTVDGVVDDEMTYKNAARYGAERVEVRSEPEDGIVSIRYLP